MTDRDLLCLGHLDLDDLTDKRRAVRALLEYAQMLSKEKRDEFIRGMSFNLKLARVLAKLASKK